MGLAKDLLEGGLGCRCTGRGRLQRVAGYGAPLVAPLGGNERGGAVASASKLLGAVFWPGPVCGNVTRESRELIM